MPRVDGEAKVQMRKTQWPTITPGHGEVGGAPLVRVVEMHQHVNTMTKFHTRVHPHC